VFRFCREKWKKIPAALVEKIQKKAVFGVRTCFSANEKHSTTGRLPGMQTNLRVDCG